MGANVTDANDVTFDTKLGDGRIAHCWRADHVEYRNTLWSAGLVEGYEPDTLYLRVERTDGREEEPLTLFLRPDELMAVIYVASGALWSAEMLRMDEADDAKGGDGD